MDFFKENDKKMGGTFKEGRVSTNRACRNFKHSSFNQQGEGITRPYPIVSGLLAVVSQCFPSWDQILQGCNQAFPILF